MDNICEFVKIFYMERYRQDPGVRETLLQKLNSLTVENNEQAVAALAEAVLTEAVAQACTELSAMGVTGQQLTPFGMALRTGQSRLHPEGCLLLLSPQENNSDAVGSRTVPVPAVRATGFASPTA